MPNVKGALARAMPAVVADFLADAEADYRYAVRAAIVQHEFGTVAGSAKLAAANVQPVAVRFPVPPQGCVDLSALPPGRVAVCTKGVSLDAANVAL